MENIRNIVKEYENNTTQFWNPKIVAEEREGVIDGSSLSLEIQSLFIGKKKKK